MAYAVLVDDTFGVRAEEHYERSFDPGRVVVIGDSIRDVMAARENGFRSVVVCTGWTEREQLLEMGPDLIFDDFSEAEPAAAEVTFRLVGRDPSG